MDCPTLLILEICKSGSHLSAGCLFFTTKDLLFTMNPRMDDVYLVYLVKEEVRMNIIQGRVIR